MGRMFVERGYRKVLLEEQPDILVINTCSVTDNADKKCRDLVKEVQKAAPQVFIVITGCYAQLKPQEIAQIPGVGAVLGAQEKFQLVDLLEDLEKRTTLAAIHVQPIQNVHVFSPSYSLGDRTRTFLKVQDGCNYHCAFCTIPLARGKSRSATVESVVQQAEEIAQQGVKEIVLTGVNIGDFGIQNNRRERLSEHWIGCRVSIDFESLP